MSVLPDKERGTRARSEKDPWFVCDQLKVAFPGCFSILSDAESYGRPRVPATIRLFIDQGRLKAAVNDPSSEMVLFITLDPEQSLWVQFEAALTNPDADWREQRKPSAKKSPF